MTSAFLTGRGLGPFASQTVQDEILDLQPCSCSLEVLVIAAAVVGGARSGARTPPGAGGLVRAHPQLAALRGADRARLAGRVVETLFLGPGYERLLGRAVTRDTSRRAAYEAMHPADRAAVAANAAYATLASGRETSVDWRVPADGRLPVAADAADAPHASPTAAR